MMDKKQHVMDAAASYGIGGFGMGWGSFVALSGELTTIFGMITAFLGMVVVGVKLYYDLKRARNGRKK